MKVVKVYKKDSHEYNILVEKHKGYTQYSLYYSEYWVFDNPNEFIMAIIDNGIEITMPDLQTDSEFIEQLTILLNFISKQDYQYIISKNKVFLNENILTKTKK